MRPTPGAWVPSATSCSQVGGERRSVLACACRACSLLAAKTLHGSPPQLAPHSERAWASCQGMSTGACCLCCPLNWSAPGGPAPRPLPAGFPPFWGSSDQVIFHRILNHPVVSPRNQQPGRRRQRWPAPRSGPSSGSSAIIAVLLLGSALGCSLGLSPAPALPGAVCFWPWRQGICGAAAGEGPRQAHERVPGADAPVDHPAGRRRAAEHGCVGRGPLACIMRSDGVRALGQTGLPHSATCTPAAALPCYLRFPLCPFPQAVLQKRTDVRLKSLS